MALAGEAYMKEIDMERVKEIEKELSKLAKTISDEWKLRHFQSPLEKAASIVLGKEAFADSLEEDTTGDSPMIRAHRQMLRKLEGLIKLLPQYQQDKFDAVEILPGYLCWFEFNWVQVPESVPLNEVYSVWYKKHVKKENSPECNGKFAPCSKTSRSAAPVRPSRRPSAASWRTTSGRAATSTPTTSARRSALSTTSVLR